MKVSRVRATYVALDVALFVSVLFISITASQPPCDPWLDTNDDGYGGIDDIVSTAEHFGALGDPTKRCNITNWPIGTDMNVFWQESLVSSAKASNIYDASGFSHLHLLAYASGLATLEAVEIQIYGFLPNPAHSADIDLVLYTFTLTSSTSYRNLTIPVPSRVFAFVAAADVGTACYVYLSFYLTWA
jgi:hypothetical protein